mmetsp:Transcript_27845/g.86699  ORF Transcript_27845/g.86699 Transcript_27845/m.86699 type:complete len:212 (+) Transcript_27845:586-1221(+)
MAHKGLLRRQPGQRFRQCRRRCACRRRRRASQDGVRKQQGRRHGRGRRHPALVVPPGRDLLELRSGLPRRRHGRLPRLGRQSLPDLAEGRLRDLEGRRDPEHVDRRHDVAGPKRVWPRAGGLHRGHWGRPRGTYLRRCRVGHCSPPEGRQSAVADEGPRATEQRSCHWPPGARRPAASGDPVRRAVQLRLPYDHRRPRRKGRGAAVEVQRA